MNTSRFHFLITALLVFGASYAQANELTLEQKLATVKLEQRQAEVMIKKMQARGRMDSDEASHAKREIASVKEEDVQQIRVEALETLKSAKSFATK